MALESKQSYLWIALLAMMVITIIALSYREPLQWQPSWHEWDDHPHGGKALHLVAAELFAGKAMPSVYESLLENAPKEKESLLIACVSLDMDKRQVDSLLRHVQRGGTALLAAHYFSEALADTLNLVAHDQEMTFPSTLDNMLYRSSSLRWRKEGFPQKPIPFTGNLDQRYLTPQKSERNAFPYRDVAFNSDRQAVVREYRIGQGLLAISTIPLALGNYYLLDSMAHPIGMGLLSLLPAHRPVKHYEYYQVGRLDSHSPLRYVLSEPALRWALYLTLGATILFMIFGGKRRQRMIPILPAVSNRSLEFVKSLGELYFHHHKGKHQGLVNKRRRYFYDYVLRHYGINPKLPRADFITALEQRSGVASDKLKSLLYFLERPSFTDETLLQMEKQLYHFYTFR